MIGAGPLASLAAAEPDVYLAAQFTPEKPKRGDTVQVDLQALQGAAYVDLDNITGRIFYYNGTRENLTFTHNGTGRYVTSIVMPLEVLRLDPVNVIAEGWRAGKKGTTQVYVTPADMPPFVNPGLMLFGALDSEGLLPYHFAPGDRLLFHLWTYLNGKRQDVGPPVGTGHLRPHGLPSGGRLTPLFFNTTRVGNGTYEIVTDIPRDIHITNEGYVSAQVPNMTLAYGSAVAFSVDPFTAVAVFESLREPGDSLRVCAAGGRAPLPNASVEVELKYAAGAPSPNLVTGDFLTGADGCGQMAVHWPANYSSGVDASIGIAWGADGVFLSTHYRRSPERLTYPSVVELPGDFVVERLGDPGDVAPGADAQLSFAVTQGGSPFANGTLGVVEVWWRGDKTQVPVLVANRSTDSSGFLNLTYSIPTTWSAGLDFLTVLLYTPAGDEAGFTFGFGPYRGYPDLPGHEANLTVAATEDVANGTLHVRAAYSGEQNLSGWRAVVLVLPVRTPPHGYWTGTAGDFPDANVALNGSVVETDIVLPPWLWEADFQVIVIPYTFGQYSVPEPRLAFENSTVVHLHARPAAPAPEAPLPPGPPPPPRNNVLVFAGENLWILLLLALLVAGVAAVLVVTRRHKAADEEEPPP